MNSVVDKSQKALEKTPYQSPEINDLGTIEEVTKGGISNGLDTGTASNP